MEEIQMRTTRCAECDKLRRELLNVLDKFAKLAAAEAEALRGGEESMLPRLQSAVDIAVQEKERAYEALLEHRQGHG
jgi:hypothetical protein